MTSLIKIMSLLINEHLKIMQTVKLKQKNPPNKDGFNNAMQILKQIKRDKNIEYWVKWHTNDHPARIPSVCVRPAIKTKYFETHIKQGKPSL